VNPDRLRERLRREPVPDQAAAEDRAWNVVRSAYEERTAIPPKPQFGHLAIALAGAALLAALLLSPAGAAVRDWIHDVVEGEDHAAQSLSSLPAPGELLVESDLGPWIVQQNGSKRLLGAYDAAAFSPHGRFAVVADGRELAAVVADADAVGQPEGTPHWTLDAPHPVRDPAWAPSGVRVAYRTGDELWVVRGDGEHRALLAHGVSSIPLAWRPLTAPEAATIDPATGIATGARNLLAYVDKSEHVHVVDVRGGRELLDSGIAGDVRDIAWSPDGRHLAIVSDGFFLVVDVHGHPVAKGAFGGSQAVFSPSGGRLAFLEHSRRPGGVHSDLTLLSNLDGAITSRHVYGAPGVLNEPTWAPNGRWLLVAYPGADQWVFLPIGHGGHPQAVAGITDEFNAGSRGQPASFPRVSGWIDG
jgi:hypothetical protein